MSKSKQWKAARQVSRKARHSAKRRGVANSTKPQTQYALWFGNRRPIMQPKSNEGLLTKLEETGVIPPRAVRMLERKQRDAARLAAQS